MIKTLEQAHQFVQDVKVCTIFPSKKVTHPSLWEHVDLPDKQPGEKGWSEKMSAVWTWKTQLPAVYPNDIYYGKIKGGLAVLMDRAYMAEHHFAQAYKPLDQLKTLDQHIWHTVEAEPLTTTALRKGVIQEFGCTKSQFDTALKRLQITMNIVRMNDPQVEQDTWVPFKEMYLDVWERYVTDDD